MILVHTKTIHYLKILINKKLHSPPFNVVYIKYMVISLWHKGFEYFMSSFYTY